MRQNVMEVAQTIVVQSSAIAVLELIIVIALDV